MSKGIAAPAEKVAADVSAAWIGRAVVIFRNPKFLARVGGQGVLRHQLLGNLPRKCLIYTALDVDIGKFIKLKLRILAQLLAFARQVRLLCVGLRANRHILAGGHRHGTSYQTRDSRDQYIVLCGSRCGNADDQARGRNNSIIGAKHCSAQPADACNEMLLRVQAKTAHLSPPSRPYRRPGGVSGSVF
jgi:hypothetical protein